MKGISTVLAVILIVIIVVALVGLTYTFAVTLFGTAAGGAEAQAAAVTERLQKSVTFVGAACDIVGSTATYTFTLRNTGTLLVEDTDLAAFVNGVRIPDTAVTPPWADIAAGAVDDERSFTNQTVAQGTTGVKTLTISAPAASVDKSVTC